MKNNFYSFLIIIAVFLLTHCKTGYRRGGIITVEDLNYRARCEIILRNLGRPTGLCADLIDDESGAIEGQTEFPVIIRSDPIYKILIRAKSIRILAFDIESGDFATSLFKLKLRGKDIKVALSLASPRRSHSRKKYFDQVGIETFLVNLSPDLASEAFIIVDDRVVVRDILIPLSKNENTPVSVWTMHDEMLIWEFCRENSYECHSAFKKISGKNCERYDQNKSSRIKNNAGSKKRRKRRRIIPRKLPRKTKYQEFIENQKKFQ